MSGHEAEGRAADEEAHSRLRTVLSEIGVEPILHAGGTKSSMGGSRVHPDAADVMRAALDVFVPVEELLAGVGDATARMLGVESAAVVAGAASGCVLAAAAVRQAAADRGRGAGRPTMLTQRRHYGRYTYLYEQGGCAVRELGTMNDCPRSEYVRALDASTVGLAWLEGPGIRSAGVSLADACAVAHEAGVPVVVDAAAMAFPLGNVYDYLSAGADLVVVSGGKLINGPQSSGFVFGRADLVRRIRRLSFPHQGVGRAHKITKELALGAYTALKHFLDVDPDALVKETAQRAERIAATLEQGGVEAEVQCNARFALPTVVIGQVKQRTGREPSAWNAVLLDGSPRIFLPYDDAVDELRVELASLDADDEARVAGRIVELMGTASIPRGSLPGGAVRPGAEGKGRR